jgi:aryl-alcohol dehydrogenase
MPSPPRPTGACGLIGVPQGDYTLDPVVLTGGRNLMGILEGDAVRSCSSRA